MRRPGRSHTSHTSSPSFLDAFNMRKNFHLIYTDFPEVHTIRLVVVVPIRTISAFQRVAFDLKLILWFFNISRTCEISYWILVEITRISSIVATLEKRVCSVEFRLSFDRIRQHNRYIDEETSKTSLPALFWITLNDYHSRTQLEKKTSNDYCWSLCDDTATLHGSLVRSSVTLSNFYQGMEIQSN